MWKDRRSHIAFEPVPLIGASTRIATIGSCFAAEIAAAIDRLGLCGAMHPTGLYYTSASLRQEIERVFGGWREAEREPLWRTSGGGWVHPFKDYSRVFQSESELRAWSEDLDRRGEDLFRTADVVVLTLGLIEGWMNPETGNHYRQIPHPDVFPVIGCRPHRSSVEEVENDLERIWTAISRHSSAKLVVTVSPVPLHATVTSKDVRVANVESKSRLRAAVSQFVERHAEVHYFHAFEIVTTAERQSDFMLADGRHVARRAVDLILQQFLLQFAATDVRVPSVDTSWLTSPEKVAPRIAAERDGLVAAAFRRTRSVVRRFL